MQKLESLDSATFQPLSKKQLSMINGGGILPRKGTENLGTLTNNETGETATYYVEWRTGFFSNEKEYGTAYEVAD